MKSFWIALQFFTLIPTPKLSTIDDQDLAASVLWYPVVGVIIGGVLLVIALFLMPLLSSSVVAAFILLVWVAITGALHLDGLADCADAWMGGFGSKQRTLEIMKDPVSGPIAVCVLVTCLLLKFVLIETLIAKGISSIGVEVNGGDVNSGDVNSGDVNSGAEFLWLALFIVPVMARLSAVVLLLTTRYVREGGLGSALSEGLELSKAWGTALLFTLFFAWMNLWLTVIVIVCSLVVFYVWRRAMINRIEGCTGDTLGAMIEVVELAALFGCALYLGTSII